MPRPRPLLTAVLCCAAVCIASSAAQQQQPASPSPSDNLTSIGAASKLYAIVFPQFHSDPLNDKLWGTNYTDWSRLKKAPAFNKLGQHIVRPTADLGYYDLTEYGTRKRYSALARQYGIDGFLYYHYWWNQQDPKVTSTDNSLKISFSYYFLFINKSSFNF
jgi:hypothetical protein